jgi:hypothetical protein
MRPFHSDPHAQSQHKRDQQAGGHIVSKPPKSRRSHNDVYQFSSLDLVVTEHMQTSKCTATSQELHEGKEKTVTRKSHDSHIS